MKLLKYAILSLSIIGLVAFCGCMSSSENATGKQTINGEEVVKTQEVKQPTFSNKVKVQVGDNEIEMSAEDYDIIKNNKVPSWVIERLHRDLGIPKDKLKEIEKNVGHEDAILMVPYALGERFIIKGFVCKDGKFFKETGDLGPISIVSKNSNQSFIEFCLINGANDVYLNESKYQKQYGEFISIRDDVDEWFNTTVKGHLTVVTPLGAYTKNIDDSLDVYLLKNGWAFIPKGEMDYNGTTPINPYEDEKDKLPFAYNYWQKRIEAQQYAQEHKLGIWAIEFNEEN